MRWIIGIDLRERSSGTLHMAAWLREHAGAVGFGHEFVGMHVVDEAVRRSLQIPSEVVAAAENRLRGIAEHSGIEDPLASSRVVIAPSAEDGLAEAMTATGVDGGLIGRAAPIEGRSIRRLGRVARRLLRRLPAPLMVVPPYLVAEDIGRGGILLATDLEASSETAARFARRLATELGRELVVLHVDRGFDVVPDLLGEGMALAPTRRHTLAQVEQWAQDQDLGPFRALIVDGRVVEHVLAEAQLEDAPVIVCGSRRLSVAERIFTSSVGSDLARWADRAVLVVPSARG